MRNTKNNSVKCHVFYPTNIIIIHVLLHLVVPFSVLILKLGTEYDHRWIIVDLKDIYIFLVSIVDVEVNVILAYRLLDHKNGFLSRVIESLFGTYTVAELEHIRMHRVERYRLEAAATLIIQLINYT